eukprot:scaffold55312_cov79-Phaeocystis_antarctica.AAC.1
MLLVANHGRVALGVRGFPTAEVREPKANHPKLKCGRSLTARAIPKSPSAKPTRSVTRLET